MLSEQPVNPRDADVEQAIDGVTHYLCSHACLFRDRQIRCAGGGNQNGAAAGLDVILTVRDGTSNRVEYRARDVRFDGGERLGGCAGYKQSMAVRDDFPGNCGDLFGRFP
jgi:hypothetical protein